MMSGRFCSQKPNLQDIQREVEGHVAFEIGDKVIYPNHGLGVIQRIETKTIMGTTCGFYQLRMANETTVFVPVDNVDGVGLRRAISDGEVDRLFSLLGDGNIDSHQNWKGRFKDNSDRMRTGSIYDVVEVLKGLTFLAKSKSLSFREKRMLDRAKFLVVSEISEVLGEDTPAVEVKVERHLEECFAAKAKNTAKGKPATPPAPPRPPVAVSPPTPPRTAPVPLVAPAANGSRAAAPAAPAAASVARSTAASRVAATPARQGRPAAGRTASAKASARPAAARRAAKAS